MKIETVTPPADPARALLTAAARADGVDPFSEQFILGLSDARLRHRHVVAREGEEIVGIAASDGAAWELVVHPAYRRRGIGTALLDAVGDDDVWAHGNLPGARALAATQDRRMSRRLLVMAVAGEDLRAAAQYTDPAGMTARNLPQSVERHGRDVVEEAWLRTNNEAFSWHPEQGGWDRERLSRAQEAEWFAPEDVLFLWAEDEAAMAGFHWTKWHTEEDPAFGEVYVVGLAGDFRGRGLGGPLLQLGLGHLVGKGADRVILYVEADNAPAVKVYEDLGFTVTEEHVVWSR